MQTRQFFAPSTFFAVFDFAVSDDLQLADFSLDVFAVRADVSKEADVSKLFDFALEKLGGLNVLINNAGIGFIGSLLETSVEDFTRIWETNTRSAFVCGQLAAKHFVGQNTGNIVNVSSMGAVNGFAGGSAYASSKYGDEGFDDVLAGGTAQT